MKLTVCSGFNPANKDVYGLRFHESFRRYWPRDVTLKVYVEEPTPELGDDQQSLWDCRGVREFIEANRGTPAHCGQRPEGATSKPDRWREKEWEAGYSFRFDAVKFCRQLFIPERAADGLADGDVLVWLDGDVVTLRDVPIGLVPSLLAGADGAYLGRMGTHSEIGFWAVRIGRGTRDFLAMLADTYRTGRVFDLRETHSAFVWDHCRQALPGLHFRNLTPRGAGHVWPTSPLAQWLRHDKGKRKYR